MSDPRRIQLLALVAIFFAVPLGAPPPAAGELIPLPTGPEFRVGGDATAGPAVAANDHGAVAVLWVAQDCAGGGPGLCLSAFEPGGAPGGPEAPVDGPSLVPAVALTSQGVLWAVTAETGVDPTTTRIVARRYSLDGALAGSMVVETALADEGVGQPDVAAQPGGGAVVVWRRSSMLGAAVHGRRLAADGQLLGSRLEIGAGGAHPAVGADATGRFVVAWEAGDDVVARGFVANGTPLGDAFAVAAAAEDSPAVAATPDGAYLVAWTDREQPFGPRKIVGRAVSPTGPAGPPETVFTVPSEDFGESFSLGLAGLADGFAAVWTFNPVSFPTVYVRFLDRDGAPLSPPETPVAPPVAVGGDRRPAVAADGAGSLLVAWERTLASPSAAEEVYARRFAVASTPCAPGEETLCLLGGRFRVEVAWRDHRSGSTGVGHAVPYGDQTGFFWFFDEANLELTVKALDGRTVNGHFWFFYGALSDVEYTITATDTASGEVATYFNPPGEICGRGDTTAF